MQRLWNKKFRWTPWFVFKNDTLLSAIGFENFREISPPALGWETALKNTEVESELLTDINMVLMVEKGIRGGICNIIHWYVETNNKYTKEYDTNKE